MENYFIIFYILDIFRNKQLLLNICNKILMFQKKTGWEEINC